MKFYINLNGIEKYKKELDKRKNEMLAKLTADLYDELIKGNPVLTGKSRTSWNVTLNSPDFKKVDEPKVKPVAGTPPSGFEERRSGKISTVKKIQNKGADLIYLADGHVYMEKIEKKYGFVRRAREEALRKFNND